MTITKVNMFDVVMQSNFKDGIFNSVNIAVREYGYIRGRYDRNFVALVVMYNPTLDMISNFSVSEYGSFNDEKVVNNAINETISRINDSEKYSHYKYVTVIKAKDINNFENLYRGHYGYPTEEQRNALKMEEENFALKTYLEVIKRVYDSNNI